MNFQKHATTRTATNSRVAPTPPWIRAAMTRPPQGGSVGFYDDPDEDTIEMVLSPEDMRKLSHAAAEQPAGHHTEAQAEHLLHRPHQAVQSKLPTASSPGAPPGEQPVAPGTPQMPPGNAAVAPPPAPFAAQGKPALVSVAPHVQPAKPAAALGASPMAKDTPAGASVDTSRAQTEPAMAARTPSLWNQSRPALASGASPSNQDKPATASRASPSNQGNPGVASDASPATRHNQVAAPSAAPVPQATPAAASTVSSVPQAQATAVSTTPSAGPPANLPRGTSSEGQHPPHAQTGTAATTVPTPRSAKNLKSAWLAGGALAAVVAALLIVGMAGVWSTPSAQGIEQPQAKPTTPNPQRPQPALAAPEAPAAVAPALEPKQPAEPPPAAAPVRFKNPFDRSEIFEFPAGTSLEDARQSVAGVLLQRARDRHHPGIAQGRTINGVTPGRPARNTDLAQNSVRGR